MKKIQRIVITGVTGTIGMAIIEQMIKQNIQVLAICNPNSSRNQQIYKNPLISMVNCDLNHLNTLNVKNFPAYDIFYHLGWIGTVGESRNNTYMQTQNISNSLDAVDLAKRLGCHTFIGAGSQAEYGRTENILRPDTPTNPENGYGIAKLCAGKLTRLRCSQLNLRHIWIRIFSVYGPYDGANSLISSMISKLADGIIPQTTAGEQLWDYLYSGDAGKAFYLAGLYGKNGTVYCLGSGVSRPLKNYIMTLRDIIAPDMQIEVGAIPYSQNQVMHLQADISTLQEDTGFYPEISFENGIKNTFLWYESTRGRKEDT